MFSAAMAASSARQTGPLTKRLSNLFPSDDLSTEVTIVDVGGGRGQILNALRTARPHLKGEMIVQDLEKEVEGRELFPGIRSMVHDFFTPQPIQGRQLYSKSYVTGEFSDSRRRLNFCRCPYLLFPAHLP